VSRIAKSMSMVTAATALVAALALPAIGSGATAKTKPKTPKKTTVSITCKSQGDPAKGLDPNAPMVCPKPLGAGKQVATLVIPVTEGSWIFKHGTLHFRSVGVLAGGTVTGKATLSKGTGTFKGCTGKGTFSGSLATALFVFKMKVTC
jgi:hypothetical protein